MRLHLFPLLYKVRPRIPNWKGWRVRWYGIAVRERCACNVLDGCEAEDYGWSLCECRTRQPHRHTYTGEMVDRPIGLRNSRRRP